MRLIAHFLILCIETLNRPLLGPSLCLYSPSCSRFAIAQLQEKSLHTALIAIVKRLLSCNSFTN